tara:strand:+ start:2545 stop:3150 length:606 start_codon:yes stop_codon:yes gene_type:complete
MNQKTVKSAISHLKKDEKLKPLIEKFGNPDFGKYEYPYKSLIKFIIYQQLSLQSAKAIYDRFLNLSEENIKPDFILKIDDDKFKSVGLSNQKIKYIKEISLFFLKNDIDFSNLDNDEVYNKLIKIKGIGPWTIDMFLMFTLYRTDILPIGDLGIKKGFKILFDLNELPTDEFMIKESKSWSPYRTVASIYLWKIIDGDTAF